VLLCIFRGFGDWRVIRLGTQAVVRATIALDLASFAAGESRVETFAVSGAETTGTISPGSALPTGLCVEWCRVSASGTVAASFRNNSNAAIDPGSMSWNLTVVQ
jgi:hypothetical protein